MDSYTHTVHLTLVRADAEAVKKLERQRAHRGTPFSRVNRQKTPSTRVLLPKTLYYHLILAPTTQAAFKEKNLDTPQFFARKEMKSRPDAACSLTSRSRTAPRATCDGVSTCPPKMQQTTNRQMPLRLLTLQAAMAKKKLDDAITSESGLFVGL